MENIDPALLALGLAAGFFTNIFVDVFKQMLGRSRKRKWLLPLLGVVIGITFVGLIQVYREQPATPKTVAGVVLAGIVAFGLATVSNDQSKKSEEAGKG